MKKIVLYLICVVSVLCFAGCDLLGQGEPKTTTRDVTVIPDFDTIKETLEKKGYTTHAFAVNDGAGKSQGVGVTAENPDDGEYLEIYRLDNPDDCDTILEEAKDRHETFYKCVSIKGDPEYGNIVYICTQKAYIFSGIINEHVVETVTD